MTTILAQFKVQPGKEDEAEKALNEMAAAVEANEPGALVYIFHRSQKDPGEITVFEVYSDGEAFDAHGQSPHMAQFRSNFASLFDPASVKIERLERIAGFVRPPA
jgi:quinol monooxygenase YgiN